MPSRPLPHLAYVAPHRRRLNVRISPEHAASACRIAATMASLSMCERNSFCFITSLRSRRRRQSSRHRPENPPKPPPPPPPSSSAERGPASDVREEQPPQPAAQQRGDEEEEDQSEEDQRPYVFDGNPGRTTLPTGTGASFPSIAR